jgi:serine/alanine adding enzyme
MFQVLDLNDSMKWKRICEQSDIYYSPHYHQIYEGNKEGQPLLFHCKMHNIEVIHPILMREIPDTGYFDLTSAYGYAGPYIRSNNEAYEDEVLNHFFGKLGEFANENGIVSEFVRFHPLIFNHRKMNQFYDVEYVRDTVYIQTSSIEDVWGSIHSKKRNMIRKAEKNNVEIIDVDPLDNLDHFYNIYISTMDKNEASDSYYLSISYFRKTIELLSDNVKMFVAAVDSEIVSASLFLLKKPYAHYHFSGTLPIGLKLAANDLLLYRMSEYLVENGYTHFHLGGGHTSNDDPLFKFKKRFSKDGRASFHVGKKIHLPEIYNALVERANVNDETNFFPLYRYSG